MSNETNNQVLTGNDSQLEAEKIVYFSRTEEFWDKPYVRKRHHVCPTRTVILKGKIVEVLGNQFKATLFENNSFEMDGQTFVFHKNDLLSDQNFQHPEQLGVWKMEDEIPS